MSNEGCLNQMVMCMNAIHSAVEANNIKKNNPRKRKDGTADWAAAYYFSRLNNLDVGLTTDQMRQLYYDYVR